MKIDMSKDNIRFSEKELYQLWLNCKDNENAITIMSDFIVDTKAMAQKLIEKFELQYECNMLDSENRGITDRVRKHI